MTIFGMSVDIGPLPRSAIVHQPTECERHLFLGPSDQPSGLLSSTNTNNKHSN